MRFPTGLVHSRFAQVLLVIGVLSAPVLLAGCSTAPQPQGAPSPGPLSEYFLPLRMSQEAAHEAARVEHERVEALTAACMSAEGFDYTPQPFTGGPVQGSQIEATAHSEADSEAEEFAGTYGYGIVEDPVLEAASQDAAGQLEGFVDANSDYRNSLTESEQDAYWDVLNGPPLSEEELQAIMEDGPTTAVPGTGCLGEARDQARSEQNTAVQAREDPDFQDLFEAENALYEPLNAEAPTNEDVIALNSRWSQCMTKRGHSIYVSPLNARNTLGQEFEQMEVDSSDLNAAISEAEADRFQTLEIDVASADLACQESVDYDAELDRITRALEQTFVDEYQSQLDALVVRYGTPEDQ